MQTYKQHQNKIHKLVEGLREINPEKIILFGSSVSGKFHKNSDIDICVVTNKGDRLQTKRQLWNIIWNKQLGFEPEIDIHVYPSKMYSDRLEQMDPFIAEIEKGEILYEK